jgi:hypothetical protein
LLAQTIPRLPSLLTSFTPSAQAVAVGLPFLNFHHVARLCVVDHLVLYAFDFLLSCLSHLASERFFDHRLFLLKLGWIDKRLWRRMATQRQPG